HLFLLAEEHFINNRSRCDDNQHQDNVFKVIFHPDALTQQVTDTGQSAYPGKGTDHVNSKTSFKIHTYHTGNYGSESTYNRQKTRQDNRHATPLFIESPCRFKMFPFEDPGVFLFKQQRAGFPSEPITDQITQYACKRDKLDPEY